MTEAVDAVERLIAEGHALEDAGRLSEAHSRYSEAATLAPTTPRPWLNLGNILQLLGRRQEALAATERAIVVAPDFAPSHYNLGRLCLVAGDLDRAERALRTALGLDPQFADASVSLADVLVLTGRPGAAEALLQNVAATDPPHPGATHNLGLLLLERGALDEAEACVRCVIDSSPRFALACATLGNVLFRAGRAREAEIWFRRCLAIDPACFDAAKAMLFSFTARDDLTPQQIFDAHREFGRVFDNQAEPSPIAVPETGHRRIRIGYLSSDFCSHAVALFIRPVLEHHDRNAFEIFCYHALRSEDRTTILLKGLADHWRDLANLDDAATIRRLRADALDILVDLGGYTAHSRTLLLAKRCAQVQASWLGYLHSTGLTAVDYRICDGYTDPPGMTERYHTERLARMPLSQWCYEPIHHAHAPLVDPARDAGPVVFGSFNQFWKISDLCLELWIAILQRTPGSILRVVGVPEGETMTRFRDRLTRQGIAANRTELSARVDVQRYFAAIAGVDIALDTTPYNGATTTLDVLWTGVPVVALAGDRSIARGGVSILNTIGLPELVANSRQDYVDLNVRLARDPLWRAQLRSTLRPRLEQSPLMDGAGFTRNLEALYRDMSARAHTLSANV